MLVTERLMLRAWWDDDWERMAAINGDAAVMRFLGGVQDRAESDRAMARMLVGTMNDGLGPWGGPRRVKAGLPCAPCVELVWRIGAAWQGQGFATEAARAAVSDLFEVHGVPELVAVTAVGNEASRRVMEKLGMTSDRAEDFDHPLVPAGHPLARHVLYRLKRPMGGVPIWRR